MARPYKARRICSVPAIDTFGPLNQEMDSAVELTLEEYETIRLIDWAGLHTGTVRRPDGGGQDHGPGSV